jgi:hypothetical protein
MSKCPKCEKLFTRVNAVGVDVDATGNSWKGISYNCPFCFTSLGVVIDQVALKTDLRNEILKALGKNI